MPLKCWSAIVIVAAIVLGARSAHAQAGLFPDFFELERPGHAVATTFGGGFGSDKYGTVEEGFQLEQSVTPYIGMFGRATGYQLWIGSGFLSPLNPDSGSHARLNFGRLQGGIDFAPLQNLHLFVSAGHDLADSDGWVFEADLSSWLFVRTRHPLSFSFSALYNSQNAVTSAEIDLQAVLLTRGTYMLLAGAGGAIYGGGFLSGVSGQSGPDLTFYYRPWAIGISAQAGYGDAHRYGQLAIFKQFAWHE